MHINKIGIFVFLFSMLMLSGLDLAAGLCPPGQYKCYSTGLCVPNANPCPACSSISQSNCGAYPGCQWCSSASQCIDAVEICPIATPAPSTNTVYTAVSDLCSSLTGLLPPLGMLMVVMGSVIYAGGQVMGAETRARANVWATAMITGALVMMLISSVAPSVLQTAYGQAVSCTAVAP